MAHKTKGAWIPRKTELLKVRVSPGLLRLIVDAAERRRVDTSTVVRRILESHLEYDPVLHEKTVSSDKT